MPVGIVHGIPELDIQQVLHKTVEVYGLRPGGLSRHKAGHGLVRIAAPLSPGREFGGAKFVPKRTENGIGAQPGLVLIHEGLVRGRCRHRLPPGALEELAEQRQLGRIHLFIIFCRKGFQLLLLGLVGSVFAHAGIGQMEELRMQGEGAHGVVRIGVLPAARHGGVVHREQLDHALASLHGPVHQLLEVVEFSHAKAVLRAEGEHRNGHAGSPPGFRGEAGLDIGQHYLGILRGNFREEMVGTFLPQADGLGLGIYDDEFVFDGFVDVHGEEPPGGQVV